ncbi:uncharacterized protein P174DRAFT_497523 [Aspergillus novofumigatus IBT 16806]|uniref:Uncharacterized protein n=1 Tax=Aspergillus novofumigatus (strain IBT 16806) TaxID=1392255 RepID=A0A2I1BYS3_ASPN1|nr:uncharacterized protein P174DRAFT_497523 [Aspergillus novofumigatus IBT 16806]PKX90504.1 hypothetical protein P174DRAFT_497523 [Aspergillus novofumigatus IBT 16806]
MSFKKLHYVDSAVRGTLCLAPVFLYASIWNHPALGPTPAPGMWIAASNLDVHRDEKFYHKGQSYQSFRFLKEQPMGDGMSPSRERYTQDMGMPPQKITRVTPNSLSLPFGSGRHAP